MDYYEANQRGIDYYFDNSGRLMYEGAISLPAIDVGRNDVASLFSGTPVYSDGYGFIPGRGDGGSLPFNNDVYKNFAGNTVSGFSGFFGGILGGVGTMIFSWLGAAITSYDSSQYRPADPNYGYGSFVSGTAPDPGSFMPVDHGYGISDPGAYQQMYYPYDSSWIGGPG